MINTIILGHALNILPQLPAESVSCVTCSPPYWGLRDYGVEPVMWDGDKDCEHDFSIETKAGDIRYRGKNSIVGSERNPKVWEGDGKGNFCTKCSAWRGSLGLEPDFNLYVKHLCDIFDEVKRVLRKDGTCWVNIGDSYGGSGNASGHTKDTKNLGYKTSEMGATQGNQRATRQYAKCLLDIPYRFSIEMTNRGWIKRNTIIWYKKNCMPSSANDRFTIDFEYLFFFTKSNKTLFWTNEKTLECVDKKPLGTKGIEGKDWELRKCPTCNGEGRIDNKICPKCKGLWKVKYSFWKGYDYWFEQQFESIKEESKKRYAYGFNDTEKRRELRATGSANHELTKTPSYNGRNRRCVWIIPTQPFPEAHFAVYPEALIEIPVKAGCPELICKKCGKARIKIYKDTGDLIGFGGYGSKTATHIKVSPTSSLLTKKVKEKEYIGYTDCGCNAGWESGINLDPFMGAGTTALVALKQRKKFIGIEIKQEYIDMSYERIARVQQEIF